VSSSGRVDAARPVDLKSAKFVKKYIKISQKQQVFFDKKPKFYQHNDVII